MILEYTYPLLALFVVLTSFAAYLLIKIPKAYLFKWLAIPALLFGAYFSYAVYDKMLGYAYPVPLPEAFVILDHRMVKNDKGEKLIELWVLTKDGRSRLHLAPWSQKSEEQLKQAKQRGQKGVPQVGKKVPSSSGKAEGSEGKKRSRFSGTDIFDIETYNLPFEEVVPKP